MYDLLPYLVSAGIFSLSQQQFIDGHRSRHTGKGYCSFIDWTLLRFPSGNLLPCSCSFIWLRARRQFPIPTVSTVGPEMKNTVICVLLLALMLAAGCSAPSYAGRPWDKPAASAPEPRRYHTIAIPAPSTAPVLWIPGCTPYVSIDPINGTHLGDTITVYGTTNLASGELITIRISGIHAAMREVPGRLRRFGCRRCGEFNRTRYRREGGVYGETSGVAGGQYFSP